MTQDMNTAETSGSPNEMARLDATAIADLIRRKEISAVEAIDAAIARAKALQPQLNFLVTSTFEQAREKAKSTTLKGPFAGVPYLIKDMYDVRGSVSRWGSRFTQAMPPATTQGPMIDALEDAGFIFIGRSALGEMGYLPTTEPLAFGPTRNPWNLSRSPGGSSGGSAAAVAAGVVPIADAADGGGSIRIPASCCGLFGLKPSRGRMIGDQPLAAGFDLAVEHCVSRSVRDSAALFALTERTGIDAIFSPIGTITTPTKSRLRVGYAMNSLCNLEPHVEVRAGMEATAALLEGLGHIVEPTCWPVDGTLLMDAFMAFWGGSALEVTQMIQHMLGRAPDATMLEPFTLAMAQRAAARPASARDQAAAVLAATARAYADWISRYDVVLSPVLLTPPVPIGYINGDVPFDVLMDRVGGYCDYTLLHNVVGAPAMSVPLHWTADGLPVGMQFSARAGQEQLLFELAHELEAAAPWAHRRPPIHA